MAHSFSSRKRQQKYIKNLFYQHNCCLPLQPTVLGLFEKKIHPNDLPKKTAYIRLKKHFQYSKPQAQRLLYWIVKTGHFDALIRNKRAEDEYTPAVNDVDCLLEIVDLLGNYTSYNWVDINHFDFEIGESDPTLCFIQLLHQVFGLNVRITPFIVTQLLTQQGVNLFEQLLQGEQLLHLNKKEEAYLLDAPLSFTLLQAECYSMLRGEGIVADFAIELAQLIAKNELIAQSYTDRRKGWKLVNQFFVHCQKWGYPISSTMLYYFSTFVPFVDRWIRPVETIDMEILKKQEHKDFYKVLLHHLFVEYEVPAFLEPNFQNLPYHDSVKFQQKFGFFLHVAQGGNIRQAPDFPYEMSKKEAHYFIQAPEGSSLIGAYRYGQLRAMGATTVLAEDLGKLIGSLRINDEAYCLTVMRFFCQHFPESHISLKEMLLFIGLKRFKKAEFSLKGRTASSFLRLFERFHVELENFIKNHGYNQTNPDQLPNDLLYLQGFKELLNVFAYHFPWKKSEIEDFNLVRREARGKCIYRIQQLNSAKMLKIEGTKMQHCVGGYVMRCFKGQSSIWSLTCEGVSGIPERLLTIEVNIKHNQIVQIRGFKNRSANVEERNLLKLWARQARMRF